MQSCKTEHFKLSTNNTPTSSGQRAWERAKWRNLNDHCANLAHPLQPQNVIRAEDWTQHFFFPKKSLFNPSEECKLCCTFLLQAVFAKVSQNASWNITVIWQWELLFSADFLVVLRSIDIWWNWCYFALKIFFLTTFCKILLSVFPTESTIVAVVLWAACLQWPFGWKLLLQYFQTYFMVYLWILV